MCSEKLSPRIPPLEPPYTSEVASALAKWMPPGSPIEPLKLFRTLLQNQEISDRMRPLGAGLLGRHSSIDPREREIVIERVCARCQCEYEWGVHVAFFGQALHIPQDHLHATVRGSSDDSVWSERERLLVRLVDELHETSTLSEPLWRELAKGWSPSQLIELLVMVGWYHLISFVANGARIELEAWAPHFPQDERNG